MQNKNSFLKLYKTLGVKPGASLDEIKAAYRKKARLWHPDRLPENSPPQSAERFKDANNAFREIEKYYKQYGDVPLAVSDNLLHSPASHHPKHVTPTTTTSHAKPKQEPVKKRVKKTQQAKKRGKLFPIILIALVTYVAYVLYYPQKQAEVSGSEQAPVPPISTKQSAPPFAFNSTMGEVLDAQGKPDRVIGETWHYDTSTITFNELGRVKFWSEKGTKLNYYHTTSVKDSFKEGKITQGSTTEDVLRLQGPPTHVTDDGVWIYGASRILFVEEKVIAWENSTKNPLNVDE